MEKFEYVDHLKEYVTELVKRHLDDHDPEDLPTEFRGISEERLLALIVDQATPILRKIETDAINAAIEVSARLIRYSYKKQ
ncbi:hypothetical protein LCGC14_1341420 [marine sediment metagenome]|uniref:Uncharacterized protein n=1 Tax=marine sediment metagenome TaxID=412755 RepID=A0A0F9L020_9ZZZZ